MSQEHTPGPWKFKPSTHGDYNILDGTGLATSYCVQNGFRCPHETNKNAHLIAAAPELLEALECLSNDLMEELGSEYARAEWPQVFTAIAKARGSNA